MEMSDIAESQAFDFCLGRGGGGVPLDSKSPYPGVSASNKKGDDSDWLMNAVPVLFLFFNSQFCRPKQGFVLGIRSWNVYAGFGRSETLGREGKALKQPGEPFGGGRKVSW